MIEINLLPEELRKKEAVFKKIDLLGLQFKNLPISTLAVGFIGILVAIHLMLILIGIYCNVSCHSLSNKYEKVIPQKREADSLRLQSEAANNRMALIDGLMVKRISWAKKLNDLSDSMVPGIWLSTLSYDERPQGKTTPRNVGAPSAKERSAARYLVISGYTARMGEEGAALVGKFIKSLKDNSSFYSGFSDIELGSIKSDKVQDQEIMNFKITCLFEEIE